MSLLQLKIDPVLKKAIQAKADEYGVPTSSMVRFALVKTFLPSVTSSKKDAGNVFNAYRDAGGVGIVIDDLIAAL